MSEVIPPRGDNLPVQEELHPSPIHLRHQVVPAERDIGPLRVDVEAALHRGRPSIQEPDRAGRVQRMPVSRAHLEDQEVVVRVPGRRDADDRRMIDRLRQEPEFDGVGRPRPRPPRALQLQVLRGGAGPEVGGPIAPCRGGEADLAAGQRPRSGSSRRAGIRTASSPRGARPGSSGDNRRRGPARAWAGPAARGSPPPRPPPGSVRPSRRARAPRWRR